MRPLFVSYYTLKTGYEQYAHNLIDSAQKWDVEIEVEGMTSLGSWQQNCCYKPRFLINMLEKHQRPLVWIDADAVILKPPVLFDSLQADLAFRIYDDLPLEHPSKVITGTLFLQPTSSVLRLLLMWETECKQMLSEKRTVVWDQVAFKQTLIKENPANLFPLPDAYCAIFDKKITAEDEVVILHRQASRLLKKEVDQEVIPFWKTHA